MIGPIWDDWTNPCGKGMKFANRPDLGHIFSLTNHWTREFGNHDYPAFVTYSTLDLGWIPPRPYGLRREKVCVPAIRKGNVTYYCHLKKQRRKEWLQGNQTKPNQTLIHKNWVVGREMKFLLSRIMPFIATVRQSWWRLWISALFSYSNNYHSHNQHFSNYHNDME